MSAKHLLRAAFAGAVLLGVYLGHPKPADGHPTKIPSEQFSARTVDRTDVPWQTSAVEDPDHIRAF
jgi:hypothetical protein